VPLSDGCVLRAPPALSPFQSAQREIALWFKPDELADYSRIIDSWIYE
jgi:hypothetical protein